MKQYDKLFIGTRWVDPSTDATLDVRSPSTDDIVGRVPVTTIADVDSAVDAARRASGDGAWSALSYGERAAFIAKLNDELRVRAAELDHLVATESGIPLMFGSGASACSLLEYLAELGRGYDGEERRTGYMANGIVRRIPVGVVAGITPWNGPVMQVLMKIAPSLLAGNTVVVKAAEETPLSSLAVAEACATAGLPEGVVSVLSGGREVGERLVTHPDVDHVSFTGSTAVGRRIAELCGRQLKRFNLELGGKSPGIFLPDADLDATVPTAVQFGLFFNGEACAALTRLLVPRERHDEIVDRVVATVAGLKVGDPLDADTFIGPLISERQRDRVDAMIAGAIDDGATLAYQGERPEGPGWFVAPTVLTNVDNSWPIARDELFGPVLSVIPYDSVDDAVAIANDSEYGLAGAVFSASDERAESVARRIQSGHVGINTLGMDWCLPFGGLKQSGIGRELGREGFEEFTELQTLGFDPS